MTNGDTAAEILEFVENEGADMPSSVTNKMLAIVLREQHHIMLEKFDAINNRLDNKMGMIEENTKRLNDLEKAQIEAIAELKTREKIAKEQKEAKEKRFGKVSTIVGWLNDNALVTAILTAIGVYLTTLLNG
jgi:hypothetical protein